jgi:membrane protease YdiL (CAAX protease family)
VKIYQHAAKTGDSSIIWQVVIAAVGIAPISEEILFRGYIYPVFKRLIGAPPAALGAAVLFAAIHNNALGFPGLTLLALALTLTYEFTGSLLVSVFMHAWFNGISLLAMWWSARHGLVT